LVVDDEPKLVKLVRLNLEASGYEVFSTGDGEEAVQLVASQQPDLVILDILLPGKLDGYAVCQRIREFSDVPVIMLTARTREAEKLRGFEAGADDYLTKPFSAAELVARVRALLKRAGRQERSPAVIRSGPVEVDLSGHVVRVGGRRIDLTATEFKVLAELAANAGKVVLHEQLLTRVWGPEYRDEVEYLRVYIAHLRRKIEADPANPRVILTVPGVGYMFAREEGA